MHSKRYREPSYRSPNRKIALRIILTVLLAFIFSFLFCLIGIKLGKQAQIPKQEEQTTLPEESGEENNRFEFKDILPQRVGSLSLVKNDSDSFDSVSVPLCGEDGKLIYLSSVSSILYGSSFATDLKPLAAPINQAKNEKKNVCVSFVPFKLESNQDFADSATVTLIKELCSYNVDEILLEDCNTDEEVIRNVTEFLKTKKDKKLGTLLPAAIFDGIDSEKEKKIREYYSLYDFCVLDFTAFSLKNEEKGEVSEQNAASSTGEDSETEGNPPPEDLYSYDKLYSILNENSLLIAKYSLRIRLFAEDEESKASAISLLNELEIENCEIVSQ